MGLKQEISPGTSEEMEVITKTVHDLLNLKYKVHQVLQSRIDADNVKLELDVRESCEVVEVVHLANLLVKLCLIELFLELVWFSFWCYC